MTSILSVCSGAEGFTTEEDHEILARIERQLKKRFVIGSQVSEHAIVQDFIKQVSCKMNIGFITKVLYYLYQ